MQQLNGLIKSTLKSKKTESPEYYIDFLNLACLLNGVRNGVHLDSINDKRLIKRLLKEIDQFETLRYNTRWETTVWNTDKVTKEQALHSWAFKGDSHKSDDPEYWTNNSILLGNGRGYPTYSSDPKVAGRWSLNLTLNYDGDAYVPVSMMGGTYDKSKGPDDLQSIQLIKEFLEGLVGQNMYSPSGAEVFLESVTLEID